MPDEELWTITEVAAHLGVAPASARGQMSRWGVKAAEHRQMPGGRVQALFRADEVREATTRRPGRGARTDRNNKKR
ncbi:hypothetical protein [Streptomyces cinereoruber]|uniref:hypothetical protein n=1 Tax=Streptomyces cinereoruber TaxID=67260 RepID=UPI003641DF49